MVAPLPAARPFGPGGTSPCSSPAVSEDSADHRSATCGAAQNAAHLWLSPPDPRVRSAHQPSPSRRIWREHGLLKKRRRKYQRKQDLAHIKACWALFQQISAVTKDLDDIPRYWLQAQRLHLPAIQYTARDVRSGLLFWAFAEQRSASASAVFASRIQQHLDRYGVSLRDLVWQTDNGGEFKGDFPKALGDSQHVRTGRPTPIRATWKPCIASKKTNSSTWKISPAAETSSPKCTPISSTSISYDPTRTKK